MRDAWIDQRGGNVPGVGPAKVCPKGQETNPCHVVDKVFYRSGVELDLRAIIDVSEDRYFLSNDGKPVSDHRQMTACFDWSEKSPRFVMAAKNSSKCLNVGGQSAGAGTQAFQWDCLGDEFDGNERPCQVGDTLRSTHTGMYLDVERGSPPRVHAWCSGLALRPTRTSRGAS